MQRRHKHASPKVRHIPRRTHYVGADGRLYYSGNQNTIKGLIYHPTKGWRKS